MKFIIEEFCKEKDLAAIALIEKITMAINESELNEIDVIRFFDKNIEECDGCDECQDNNGLCTKKDDAIAAIGRGVASDFVIFIVPIEKGNFAQKFVSLVDRFLSSSTISVNKNAAIYALYDNYVPEKEADEIINKYIELGDYVDLRYTIVRKIHVDKTGKLINQNDLVDAYNDFKNMQ